MTRLKCKLISVRVEIVVILTQVRCLVCTEHTIGSEIILDAPMELICDVGHVDFISVYLETVFVSVP